MLATHVDYVLQGTECLVAMIIERGVSREAVANAIELPFIYLRSSGVNKNSFTRRYSAAQIRELLHALRDLSEDRLAEICIFPERKVIVSKVYYDYDSNLRTTYRGEYSVNTASSGDGNCDVTKYNYFANGTIKFEQTLNGSWANHNSMPWDNA